MLGLNNSISVGNKYNRMTRLVFLRISEVGGAPFVGLKYPS